jgi:ADP-heptose:LPS heptosyltransferase
VISYLPLSGKYAALREILDGTDLVHGYFEVDYAQVRRRLGAQLRSLRALRAWAPQLLVYLTLPRSRLRLASECLFFKMAGIQTIVGAPFRRDLREHRWLAAEGRFESEASRLARCIADLGDARIDLPQSWDLRISARERDSARSVLGSLAGAGFIGCSVGTGMDAKDWGEANWGLLLRELGRDFGGRGLVLIGSGADFERSDRVASAWPGKWLNLCGKISPRVSAAVLELAGIYLGHDSGPMHLAAAVGTPCVAIFSAREKPGVWFPFGDQHRILYHQTECYGCQLKVCVRHDKKCIRSITVEEVLAAVRSTEWRSISSGALAGSVRTAIA